MDKVDKLIEVLAEELVDVLTNPEKLRSHTGIVNYTNALANLISARAQMKCFEVANAENLPHSQSSMADKMLKSILNGEATVNQVRESFGLDPIKNGDELYKSN